MSKFFQKMKNMEGLLNITSLVVFSALMCLFCTYFCPNLTHFVTFWLFFFITFGLQADKTVGKSDGWQQNLDFPGNKKRMWPSHKAIETGWMACSLHPWRQVSSREGLGSGRVQIREESHYDSHWCGSQGFRFDYSVLFLSYHFLSFCRFCFNWNGLVCILMNSLGKFCSIYLIQSLAFWRMFSGFLTLFWKELGIFGFWELRWDQL